MLKKLLIKNEPAKPYGSVVFTGESGRGSKITAEMFNRAGQYAFEIPEKDPIKLFNGFCDKYNLILKDTEAQELLEMFTQMAEIPPVIIEKFKIYLKEKDTDVNN